MMKKTKTLGMIFLAALALTGCDKDDPQVASVVLDKTSLSVKANDTYEFKVTYEPSDAASHTYVWSSSDEKIATISSEGKLTAIAPGTVAITVALATNDQIKSTCEVTVSAADATALALNKKELELEAGAEETLSYTTTPEGSVLANPKWSSSDEAVATVSAEGKVTAVAKGSAEVIIYSGDNDKIADTCAVTVIIPEPEITVSLNKTELSLTVGSDETLTFTLDPETAEFVAAWSSSDTNIATVDAEGKIVAVAEGSATITVADAENAEIKATCAVTVIAPEE